jgi:uncharacterized protein YecT (DUF1311 family)
VQHIFLLAVIPSLTFLTLPATAEMFGPDYPPCGDQPNSVATVCVTAKTRVWDERLNKAYKECHNELTRALKPVEGSATPLDQVSGRELRLLWIAGRDHPADSGGGMHALHDQ